MINSTKVQLLLVSFCVQMLTCLLINALCKSYPFVLSKSCVSSSNLLKCNNDIRMWFYVISIIHLHTEIKILLQKSCNFEFMFNKKKRIPNTCSPLSSRIGQKRCLNVDISHFWIFAISKRNPHMCSLKKAPKGPAHINMIQSFDNRSHTGLSGHIDTMPKPDAKSKWILFVQFELCSFVRFQAM